MGRQRKRWPGSFPTFCGKQTNKRGVLSAPLPLAGSRRAKLALRGRGGVASPVLVAHPHPDPPRKGREWKRRGSLLQLALQRFNLLGGRAPLFVTAPRLCDG